MYKFKKVEKVREAGKIIEKTSLLFPKGGCRLMLIATRGVPENVKDIPKFDNKISVAEVDEKFFAQIKPDKIIKKILEVYANGV